MEHGAARLGAELVRGEGGERAGFVLGLGDGHGVRPGRGGVEDGIGDLDVAGHGAERSVTLDERLDVLREHGAEGLAEGRPIGPVAVDATQAREAAQVFAVVGHRREVERASELHLDARLIRHVARQSYRFPLRESIRFARAVERVVEVRVEGAIGVNVQIPEERLLATGHRSRAFACRRRGRGLVVALRAGTRERGDEERHRDAQHAVRGTPARRARGMEDE